MYFPQLFLAMLSAQHLLVHAFPQSGRPAFANSSPAAGSLLLPRQNESRCGSDFNNKKCAPGECCSADGLCGRDSDFCASPDCQIKFSDSCDGQKRPSGLDTSKVPRTRLGKVPYGTGIYSCERNGDVALTFDDGPWNYTKDLLDLLKKYNARATFFITGNSIGKGMISNNATAWPALIKRMVNEGHQIASHTWGHYRMSELTAAQIKQGMIYNEIALNKILGFFPTYMRPPYSDCNDQCEKIMKSLGYHIIYFDLDTEGYLHNDKNEIQTSRNIWDQRVGPANPNTTSFLQIEHDPVYWSVYGLMEYVLQSMKTKGFRGVPVGTCLNDPPVNWYRRL